MRRPRRPRPAEPERGGLVLDVLIGMAIFALIAFIAVTAFNQYRMRGYIQAAMSDATQAANAYSARMIDRTGGNVALPSGLLAESDIRDLGINRTSHGGDPSSIHVIGADAGDDTFRVCVTYRGAFAIYDTDAGGMVDAGDMSKEGFSGCVEDGETWTPDDPAPGPDDETPDAPAPTDDETPDPGTVPVVDDDHFFDEFPGDDLDGYGPDTSSVPCPTLAGIDSHHDYRTQFPITLFFDQSQTAFRAETGVGNLNYQYRTINVQDGTVGPWTSGGLNDETGTGGGYVNGSPEDVFYVEVSSRLGMYGARAPKCDTVGKFTLRNTPNWTPGAVQRLDGASAPTWSPRVSPVPCPTVVEARWYNNFVAGTHLEVRGEAPPGYAWEYRRVDASTPSASGGGLTASLGAPDADGWRKRTDTWRTNGESAVFQVFLTGGGHTGGGRSGLRSEYCTQVFRVDRPASSPERNVRQPATVLEVDSFY